jgi:hypothetical protein
MLPHAPRPGNARPNVLAALRRHAAAETPEFRRKFPPYQNAGVYLPPDELALLKEQRRETRVRRTVCRILHRLLAGRACGS